jgi:adenine deaminase
VVDDLTSFKVQKTIINGEIVANNNETYLEEKKHLTPNKFNTSIKSAEEFKLKLAGNKIRVIEALDGQLITKELQISATIKNEFVETNVENDILKIAVINRYENKPPSIAFVKNFGLKRGAIASSVAHDSHNIIVVGCDDESIARAVNLVIQEKGGLSLVDEKTEMVIGLPVAGLMSDQDCETIGNAYAKIDAAAKNLGSTLRAPYMLLSFMALLVIPQLKLSDKGLFDGSSFKFTSPFV